MEQLTQIITALKEYDRGRCLMDSTQHLHDLAYIRIEKELQPLLGDGKELLEVVRDRMRLLMEERHSKFTIQALYSRMLSLLETGEIREFYAKPPSKKTPIRHERFVPAVTQYQQYLASEGKSPYTIESYINVAKHFLNHLGDNGHENVEVIPGALVVTFFESLRTTWASTSIRTASSALRHFLGYLGYDEQMLQAVPTRCQRYIPIIPMLETEEEKAILAFLEDEGGEHRDKAILALCYYLGLRAIDIVNLRLEQIDWISETITVTQSKTGRMVVLPLLPIIGNHLQGYLLKERPDSEFRHVFLRKYAPYRRFSNHSTIYTLLQRIFCHLGIREGCRQGSHLLRHHAASKQLLCQTPLGTIASLLGHGNVDSTAIYTTVDYGNLRVCCLDPYCKGVGV
ncbi:MAG: site-specific integrase [Sphaerochaeta sp.]|jgi:site-specific recombinase XerC|nr:site-specific integrase [Sphaerochaeta sp.]